MEDTKLALETKPSFSRRDFVSAALGASLMSMVPPRCAQRRMGCRL